MRSPDLIESFSQIAREKNIDRTELGTVLEELFLTLIEKKYGDSSNCSVIVNIDKGEIEIYQEKTIVNEVNDPVHEIELEKARALEPDLDVGDTFIDLINPAFFGRRLIATAKQFLSQKIKDIEKKYIFEDYCNRVGEIIIGDVRQVQRDNVFVHIDHCELRMPKEEQIENEHYRRGNTIRAIIKSVEMTPKGPDIVISRSYDQFLYKLFEMEVPEIEDGIIEILSIAREPGIRAKIVVKSSDKRIDAVGACVGMRGSRIQAIVRELNGEKIDVINYSAQPEVLISRALAPAKPINLYIDDDRKYCLAIFDDDDMDSAIGKNYQNVSLASSVTNYTIEVIKKSEYEGTRIKEEPIYLDQVEGLSARLIDILGKADIHTVDEFLDAPRNEILKLKGIGEKVLANISAKIESHLETLTEKANGNGSDERLDTESPEESLDLEKSLEVEAQEV